MKTKLLMIALLSTFGVGAYAQNSATYWDLMEAPQFDEVLAEQLLSADMDRKMERLRDRYERYHSERSDRGDMRRGELSEGDRVECRCDERPRKLGNRSMHNRIKDHQDHQDHQDHVDRTDWKEESREMRQDRMDQRGAMRQEQRQEDDWYYGKHHRQHDDRSKYHRSRERDEKGQRNDQQRYRCDE